MLVEVPRLSSKIATFADINVSPVWESVIYPLIDDRSWAESAWRKADRIKSSSGSVNLFKQTGFDVKFVTNLRTKILNVAFTLLKYVQKKRNT